MGQFLTAISRRVTERLAVRNAMQQTFLEKAIQRSHDRSIGLANFAVSEQFAHGHASARPHLFQHLPLQRAKLEVESGRPGRVSVVVLSHDDPIRRLLKYEPLSF